MLRFAWLLFGAWLFYNTWRVSRPSRRALRAAAAARMAPPAFPVMGAMAVVCAALVGLTAKETRARLRQHGASVFAFVVLLLLRFLVAYLAGALSVAMINLRDPALDRHALDAFAYADAFLVRFVNIVSLAFVVRYGFPPLDKESPFAQALYRFTVPVDPVTVTDDYLPGMVGFAAALTGALWALCGAWTWATRGAFSACAWCFCRCCAARKPSSSPSPPANGLLGDDDADDEEIAKSHRQ